MKASVTRMTMVRMKVAKSELMFSMPILAKIAVIAAKIADKIAQNCQDEKTVMTFAPMLTMAAHCLWL
jgi:acyl CoA:acetate/3-ketoacid CoA transferase alpha subunit